MPWGKIKKRVDNLEIVYYNSCMIQSNEEKFSRLVGELFRKLNLLNRDQKVCYGITLSQCCAIETLEQRGLLSMNELSQCQGVTLSTMTRVVDVLVRDGVVRRESSPGDRRKVCIELTKDGKNLAKKLKKCTEAYTKEILDQIPVNMQDQVVDSVELLIRAIESVNPRCCV
jgi:DNA-binding MarR family transcriptional regulator